MDVDVAIEAFQVEDLVRTVVLRNDAEKGRMFFSLKRSRFGAGGPSKPVAAEHDSEANDSQDEPNALADEVEEENDSEPSDHGNGADDDDEVSSSQLMKDLLLTPRVFPDIEPDSCLHANHPICCRPFFDRWHNNEAARLPVV